MRYGINFGAEPSITAISSRSTLGCGGIFNSGFARPMVSNSDLECTKWAMG